MNGIKFEPAVVVYFVNSLVALLVAYGLDLGKDQVAAITTITTAVVAIVVAVTTRPVVVSSITGAVATALAAVAAFGLHLSGDQIGTAVTVLSIGLSLLLRQAVSPAPALTAPAPPRRM